MTLHLLQIMKPKCTTEGRLCVWFPFCQKQVWACGGNNFSNCKFINEEHKINKKSSTEIDERKEFVRLEKEKETATRARKRQRVIKGIVAKARTQKNKSRTHLKNKPDEGTKTSNAITISEEEYLSQECVVLGSGKITADTMVLMQPSMVESGDAMFTSQS